MKRKILSLLLAAIMLISVCLSGCGNGSGKDTSDTVKSNGTGQTESEAAVSKESGEASKKLGEIVNLVWQCPFTSEFGEGFYRMEAALNEMLERDIGVHVTFERTDLVTSSTDATLMLSAGEQLDIIMSLGASIKSAIDSGLVIPLDDLYEAYGQDIIEQSGSLVDMCRVGGQLYGVTPMGASYSNFGYNMKKEFADKY